MFGASDQQRALLYCKHTVRHRFETSVDFGSRLSGSESGEECGCGSARYVMEP